ncbi:ubiquitin carboxyl-terminal hydrolase 16-like [Syzygium oleosum]|uniref:ubiquitin carboxyl-terminal hydrolase 16-like n=1 Tax=Syzygium oleosum TaxID=219896 RepID=UPI0024B8CF30|nr:ubiquitin carboxyl-terminal hydrolase 16-like [Syzygium oleosum]
MVAVRDLGLAQGLALCACWVVPLIGFLIRRKWRQSVERSREIKRLLVLASEEAARAELEASVGYGAFAAPRGYQCAICYSPTTTRCARCKSVRYCSGKCQIIHWRQGHREECHPPDSGNDYSQKVTEFEEDVDYGNTLGNAFGDAAKSTEGFVDEPTSADSNCSSSTTPEKNSNIKVESESYHSESSSAKFSGFSGSTASNELSDDASIRESVGSNDSGSSDENRSSNVGRNMPGTTCDDSRDDAKPPSPKFASLVGSVRGYASLDESNKKPGCNDAQEQCDLKSESIKRPSDQMVEPSVNSSNFWQSVVVPAEKQTIISDSSLPPKLNNANLSEASGSQSHMLPSFSKFQSNEQVSRSKGFEEERFMSRDALPQNKFDKEPTLLGKVVKGGLSASKPPSLNCERSSRIGDDETTFVSDGAPFRQEHTSRRDATNIGVGHPIPPVNMTESDKVQHSVALPSQSAACSLKALQNVKSSIDTTGDQSKGSVLSKRYLAGDGSDTSGKYNDKGLFPYDLFVKLYTWKEVELLPCGLVNCGNSCYANAVLQCLAFTPPLTAYFLRGLHSKLCPKKEWCFMCEFESLIQKAKEGTSAISPIRIISQLHKIGSQLHNGREEDAHEFLRCAIDAMQSICLVKSVEMGSSSSEEETTLMGLTFGGYLRSKIRCTKCHVKSERHERMMDLTVEIEGDIGTLEQALHRFTENETLDGKNKYHCSRCKSYEKARKRLKILEAPNVLTIALKRYQSGKFGKLNKLIQFPEILNLAPYMSGTSDKSPIYRLFGVIVHLDVENAAFSGHYVCYVKNPQNKWFKIDDKTVTPMELESVPSMGAYMLLYARCSPRAPRSIRDKLISADPKHKAVLARNSGKIAALSIKPPGRFSSNIFPNSMSSDGSATIESFYSKFHRLQRILEEDSSSDNSSLFSNTSDEGSCSTDGTRDSASADDLSDYIFGERGWSSSWRNSSDSDTSSSSSSPLYSRHSPLANPERHASGFAETSPSQRDGLDSGLRGDEFLNSDITKWRRELEISNSSSHRSSSSSRRRETDSERFAWSNGSYDVKNGVSLRRSARERTD